MASSPTLDERWAGHVVLGDGETVRIRPIRPNDAPALAEFHRRQSPDSIYRRYFSPKPELTPADLVHFTELDFVDRVALVVERRGELIAWASYERWSGRDDADAAFMVDDRDHGKGIATLLLEHLAEIARSNGIRRFTAEVLADNRAMLAVFARAGWPLQRRFESGVVDLDFALDETEEFLDSVDRRERRADSRAMARLLLPRTIAVVGASDRSGSIGQALWRNVASAATVPVYPVNPNHASVGGFPSWPTLCAVPASISLAVIAVPVPALSDAIDDCIESRVRGAVIITSVDGADFDMATVVARARSHGVRIVGPGSMGIASSRRAIGLQASLVPVDLPEGPVAISLQSGSLGASVLRLADDLAMGMSWFVSLGDKCDVSANDLLQFWEDDERTRVIAMYTESFGNPRRFARIARRVSRRRPIVAVRTGSAANGPSVGALYEQAGLLEVPTVAALLDTARVLATQPVMRGRRVAVLSNARSPETLTQAALVTAGLEPVPPPLRLDWRSTAQDFGRALGAALVADDVDAVVVVHAPPLASAVDTPVGEIERVAVANDKPVLTVLMGGRDGPLRPESSLPAFAFPEPAASVLGRAYAYGRWLDTEAATPSGEVADIDRVLAAGVIAAAVDRGATGLDVAEVAEVLDAYGICVPASRSATVTEAVAAADAIGYPVAIKAEHRHIGRSVKAGVALDVADADDVADSVAVMHEALGADADVVVVQAMIPPGLDLRVRSVIDDRVGPLVSVGLGGSTADLGGDEAMRLAPLSSASATALLEASRVGPALARAGLTAAGMIDVVRRVGQLVTDHAEIGLVDLNPIIVSADQIWVTDAEISIGPPRQHPSSLRRLE